jgi:dephospho-CoA kinase
MIIGITGKSGVGKNRYAEMLCKINPALTHIDIDEIGHSVLAEPDVVDRVRKAFGNDVVNECVVDRKKLGELVFGSRDKYKELCDITWGRMKVRIDEAIEASGENCVLNWILLPKTEYFGMCELKFLITRDNESRMTALVLRDKITLEKILERDNASIEYNEADFDYVIRNEG